MKNIFIGFIKEKLFIILIYFFNTMILILFYNLISVKLEILYPLVLSIVLFTILILFEWYKFYRINRFISNFLFEKGYDISRKSNGNEYIKNTYTLIEDYYQRKLSTIKLENFEQNRLISQWIHNLKSPVSILNLTAESAKERKIEEINNTIKSETSILNNNIDSLLNIMRLENFEKDYEPVSFNLVNQLKVIINENKNLFIYNKIYPKLEFENEQITIITDVKWNKVIINQLISNAVKYSRNDSIFKNVYFKISIKENMVFLYIKDDGIGIPEYDLERVFEPFFTGENGRKNRNSSGIGLYVCKKIARKMNINLSIKSKKFIGTEIQIRYLTKL